MHRRIFGQAAAALAASALVPAAFAAPRPPLVKPRALKPGATIGVIAPSGVLSEATMQRGIRNLEAQGFKVRMGANVRTAYGGYAGTAAQRVDDLHTMFADPAIDAIWSARGGSGASAMLPHIDYALVRRNPKILVGYSDITALHLALYARAGLVSFHGPVASSTFSPFTLKHLMTVLTETRAGHVMTLADENLQRAAAEPQFAPRTIRPGVAEGRLVGGNLSTVSALHGTPYAAPLEGNLVFLEEVGEAPYRVDRMLTQLAQGGMAKSTGVMLGVFQRCVPTDADPSLSLAEVVDDRLGTVPAPSVYGYSFGHIAHQITLPVGIRARLDTEARTVTLLESAVAPS